MTLDEEDDVDTHETVEGNILGNIANTNAGSVNGTTATGRRIDVHHHALPPALKNMLVERKMLPPVGGPPFAQWDLDATLATMDTTGIEAAVVSAAVPSAFVAEDERWAARVARTANEGIAELVRDRPARFGLFAYLPLTFPAAAAAEAAYALDTLGADGVILMSHSGERYLGDPVFDPVFAALDERRAVALTHPFNLPGCAAGPFPPFVADFMVDTGRAAIQLVQTGTLDRYPGISLILPHAGGTFPYQAARLTLGSYLGYGMDPASVQKSLRRFYYDTAGPMSPYATPTLLAAAGAERILYGSDYNAVPAPGVAWAADALRADPALDDATRAAIERENALRLLPTLAGRLAAVPHPMGGGSSGPGGSSPAL
jgi:predicted TIM-barrel fold metal-dependent hydrolase